MKDITTILASLSLHIWIWASEALDKELWWLETQLKLVEITSYRELLEMSVFVLASF